MTIKELIQKLSNFNPNKEIRVLGFEEYEGCFTTTDITFTEECENGISYLLLGSVNTED